MAALEEDDWRLPTEIHTMCLFQNHCCHLRTLQVTEGFDSLSRQQAAGVLHSPQWEHYWSGYILCSTPQWECYWPGGQWVGPQSPP